ncbi:MAG: phosphoenolpyruvate carboxykinase [Alphaproteobacteria bacterium]|nr:phosphoenolpyruvate carboxykinase [Alphaproteobacteria bacterium]
MQQTGPVQSSYGLEHHGIRNVTAVHWNYTTPTLYEEAIKRGEGRLAFGGPLVAHTGVHTGRAPNDKFFAKEPGSEGNIDWGKVNRPIDSAQFEGLHKRMLAYFEGRELFVQDCCAGADPAFQIQVRVVTETAWHSLFARNMFIRPSSDERLNFTPQFTILHAPNFQAVPEIDGTNSEVFIVVDFAKRLILIGGTSYAGEIKKSVFSILNYLLPERGVLPMHCSANIGPEGDTAIFFGLSGTGKTTLSADAKRTLIGDDEHGWGDNGVFNFEGGCYAKVIRLSPTAEPEIFATTRRFGTILENVVFDEGSRMLDLDDAALTENTRASYPINFIPNASSEGVGGHPKTIIMLTADAFGVLPPISHLSPEQAMYHFLSGYTARVAGTEKGLGSEPQAAFSTCFGAPFMPRHPTVYARLLRDKIAKHKVNCWLVNTGWSGGAYGVGERMKIGHTRAMVHAALDGHLGGVALRKDPHFGLHIPESCPNVPDEVLNPRHAWQDKQAYDSTARGLTQRFEKNFKQFESHVDEKVKAVSIRAA